MDLLQLYGSIKLIWETIVPVSDRINQTDDKVKAQSVVLLDVSTILAEMGIQGENWAEEHLEA